MAQGLGRGLGSLIPKKTTNVSNDVATSNEATPVKQEQLILSDADRIWQIDPDLIDINPYQPRSFFSQTALMRLADSIKEHGILQPLVVSPKKDGRYELIAGERRLRSAKLIELRTVPALVKNESNQKKLEIALIENIQREDLNPLETAKAYQRLALEFDLTQEEIAQKVGKARSSVTNSLRLLKLPDSALEALAQGSINEAQAKQLLSLESAKEQEILLKKILRQNLTVADVDQELKRIRTKAGVTKKSSQDERLEQDLADYLKTKVEIRRTRRSGQVIIEFFNDEELGDLVAKIKA